MSAERDDAEATSASSAAHGADAASGVSVERLAERVYQLMLRDLRLERERGAGTARGGR